MIKRGGEQQQVSFRFRPKNDDWLWEDRECLSSPAWWWSWHAFVQNFYQGQLTVVCHRSAIEENSDAFLDASTVSGRSVLLRRWRIEGWGYLRRDWVRPPTDAHRRGNVAATDVLEWYHRRGNWCRIWMSRRVCSRARMRGRCRGQASRHVFVVESPWPVSTSVCVSTSHGEISIISTRRERW